MVDIIISNRSCKQGIALKIDGSCGVYQATCFVKLLFCKTS